MASAELLKYAPFVSTPEVSFFQELAHRKLNNWGLETKSVPLRGTYSYARAGDPPRFSVNNSSFDVAPTDSTEAFTDVTAPGELLNVNTSGDFKALDKNALLQSLGDRLLGDIASGAAEIDPSALSRFVVLSFADLKTHAYLYWFAFPALTCPATVLAHQPLVNVLPSMETRNDLRTGLTALRAQDASKGHLGCPPFFVIVPPPPSAPPSSDSGSTTVACPLKVLPLSSYATLPEDERQWSMFGFVDCCGLEGIPGWPLRNFMIMLAKRWGLTRAKVVCYRTVLRRLDLEGPVLSTSETNGDPYAIASANNEDQQSFVLELELQPVQEVAADHSQLPQAPPASSPTSPPPASSSPLVTRATAVLGWEANSRGKAGPKSMNLSSLMDPQRMMESAADLNLRLMKWRALPQLNTSMLAATKVLCLGAGTLGCQVARTLLGWGIKHINFVDNGRVSFSNPTRQCLFEFADCLNGGKPKAQAAAAALHRIFPSVTSQGYGLSIPMPGHALAEAEVASAAAATAQLEALILEHDVVFLLTDTRESRWLPTLLCATHDKMLINVALGMDSYLVCRHGPAPTLPSSISGIEDSAAAAEDEDVAAGTSATANRLGCYFCNDAVAPADSTKDRTLDQQCTVSRPGLAPIASATAVELCVSLLHHPLRHKAPADLQPASAMAPFPSSNEQPLGALPHQLRGYLQSHGMVHPMGLAFEHCPACNAKVCAQWRREGFGFMLRACQDANALSDVSGLSEFHAACEARMAEFEEVDDEDDGDDF